MGNERRQFGLSWLFMVPPGLQAATSILSSLVYPGLIGVVLTHWNEITNAAWRLLFQQIGVDISGYIHVLAGANVAIVIFGVTVMYIRRSKKDASLTIEPIDRPKVTTALKVSLATAVLISLFYVSGIINHAEKLNSDSRLLVIGFTTSLIYLTVLAMTSIVFFCAFLYRYRLEDSAWDRALSAETHHVKRLLTVVFCTTALALPLASFIFVPAAVLSPTFVAFLLGDSARGPLVLGGSTAAISAILYATHRLAGFPNAKNLAGSGRTIAGLIVFFFTGFFSLAPFVAFSGATETEDGRTLEGLLIIVSMLALYGSLVLLYRTNWRLLRNIVVVALVIITVDRVLFLIGRSLS
ncbi:MAG: hypothetical protein JJ878_05860 [Alphaproteobacteria bacterium]|nr:hypothetical protein [Alphaproteobacteria bacterium]